jgi:adenylate cyclase
LSKVSALEVIARNTAFQFKGQSLDVCEVARKLGVSHVLEGSVRKSGGRVRITAQLIDGRSGGHIWADRYDRDLTDIFAIQDEISRSIVDALKLKLLPEEKKAIQDRGTTDAEAYDLYLMARQYWISGNDGDRRRDEIILRLCRKAVDIDTSYARAWALMAITQAWMHHRGNREADTGIAAAERALELDPSLAEPHCVKASDLAQQGRFDEANAEIATALSLDPESWDVNKEAAFINYRQGRLREAMNQFEKAAALMESDYRSAGMMASCARGLGDPDKLDRAAQMTLERAERAIREDRSNGAALAYGAVALGELGEAERAKEWVRRALVVDPDNLIMRFNLACLSTASLDDNDAALELIAPFMERCGTLQVTHVQNDPDLDKLRDDPRFQAMIAAAKERLGIASETAPATPAASSARSRS